MAELSPPKAVIFDWDNTLVNTWPMIHSALNLTFAKFGQPTWTLDETKQRVKHSLRDSFPQIFGEVWEDAGKDYQANYRANHLHELQTLPISKDVLDFLRERGIFTAVVSNKKGDSLRKEVAHLGWAPYFATVVGSDDAARDKPHPDPVHLALQGSDIQAGEHIWFIGDTVIDLECAKNTQCTPVLYGMADAETLERCENGLIKTYGGFPVRHHALDHDALLALLKQALDAA